MIVFVCLVEFFFFKQKTAYEMRISDWSSDVCSSDLQLFLEQITQPVKQLALQCVLGRGHHAGRITTQLLRHRSAISLHDKLAQDPGMLVLSGQDVEQRCP